MTQLRAFRARKLIACAGEAAREGSAVMDDGVVLVQAGQVLCVEPYSAFRKSGHDVEVEDLGNVCLAPALINAHCHLELSYLAGRVPEASCFSEWMASLVSVLAGEYDSGAVAAAVRDSLAYALATGTAHVGDVGSRIPHVVWQHALALQKESAATRPYPVTHFLEMFGYAREAVSRDEGTAEEARQEVRQEENAAAGEAEPESFNMPEEAHFACALSGHALYSTSPERLQAAKKWCAVRSLVYSMHLAESEEEEECLALGSGALLQMLRRRVLPPEWRAPYMRPVAYAERLGLLDASTLAVHCVRVTEREAELFAQRGVHVCLCPRSNVYTGAGVAPARMFESAGVNVCLGTDSLSSNHDLDMRKEVLAASEIYGVAPRVALAWATENGAYALNVPHLGALAPGKAALFSLWEEGMI